MIILRHSILTLSLGLIVSLICAGCTQTTKPQTDSSMKPATEQVDSNYLPGDEKYPAGYYLHTVSLADESISIIAKWFTGDLKKWEILAECNPAINPNRIFIGDKIKIPRSIMTRQDPMTPEFVEQSQPKSKRKKSKKPAQSTPEPVPVKPEETPEPEVEPEVEPEEEPILFGPKG